MIKGRCPTCAGRGEIYQTERVSFSLYGGGVWKPCLTCRGTGKVVNKQKTLDTENGLASSYLTEHRTNSKGALGNESNRTEKNVG